MTMPEIPPIPTKPRLDFSTAALKSPYVLVGLALCAGIIIGAKLAGGMEVVEREVPVFRAGVKMIPAPCDECAERKRQADKANREAVDYEKLNSTIEDATDDFVVPRAPEV